MHASSGMLFNHESPAPRPGVRHPQGHPGGRPDRARPAGRGRAGQPRGAAGLGLRRRLRRRHVAHAAAGRGRRLRRRHRRDALHPRAARRRLRAGRHRRLGAATSRRTRSSSARRRSTCSSATRPRRARSSAGRPTVSFDELVDDDGRQRPRRAAGARRASAEPMPTRARHRDHRAGRRLSRRALLADGWQRRTAWSSADGPRRLPELMARVPTGRHARGRPRRRGGGHRRWSTGIAPDEIYNLGGISSVASPGPTRWLTAQVTGLGRRALAGGGWQLQQRGTAGPVGAGIERGDLRRTRPRAPGRDQRRSGRSTPTAPRRRTRTTWSACTARADCRRVPASSTTTSHRGGPTRSSPARSPRPRR